VITVLEDYEKITKLLKIIKNYDNLQVVSLSWLIDCNKNAGYLDFKNYMIKKNVLEKYVENYNQLLPDYECQRVTKLDHFNKDFTVKFG
jgi:hypothetical protein